MNAARAAASASIALEQYLHHTCIHHAERTCCADRQVDHASSHERTTIVHAAANGAAVIEDGDHASHGPCAMCAGHLTGMSAATIIGGEPAFGVCAGHGSDERNENEELAIQGRARWCPATRRDKRMEATRFRDSRSNCVTALQLIRAVRGEVHVASSGEQPLCRRQRSSTDGVSCSRTMKVHEARSA